MLLVWKALTSEVQIEAILQRSNEIPCLIFKHSTRCNISSIAKFRLEDNWDFSQDQLEPYYLDLLKHRNISNLAAETFEVHHESPQLLLIINGECVYDASHLDISIGELKEALEPFSIQ